MEKQFYSLFDGLVEVCIKGANVEQGTENKIDEVLSKVNYTPLELVEILNQSVVKQEKAKLVLATQILAHYNNIKARRNNGSNLQEEQIKRNIILIGSTGVGKTLIAQKIAKLLGVPFHKVDATKFSKVGYYGGDVEDMVRGLVEKANGDKELAEIGIIMVDEVDKIRASKGYGPDVSGVAVQQGLLTIIEGVEVPLTDKQDQKTFIKKMVQAQKTGEVPVEEYVNTKNILFIFCGAFPGIEDIIKTRMCSSGIGFGAKVKQKDDGENVLQYLTTEDLEKYGFEAEFVGRIPIRVNLEKLYKDDLFEILMLKNSAVIKMTEDNLKAYGIEIVFEEEMLKFVAENASNENTGARSLVTIFTRSIEAYEGLLPDIKNLSKIIITKEMVDGSINPKKFIEELKKYVKEKSDLMKITEEQERITRYIFKMNKEYDVKIIIPENIKKKIEEMAKSKDASLKDFCEMTFKEIEPGFKYIGYTFKDAIIIIDEYALENPKAFIAEFIKNKMNE